MRALAQTIAVLSAIGVAVLVLAVGQQQPGGAAAPGAAAGLAAMYPGDATIGADPAVIFAEDFESGDLAAIGRRWGDVSNKDNKALALSADVPRRLHAL